jgi:hypothetical protein
MYLRKFEVEKNDPFICNLIYPRKLEVEKNYLVLAKYMYASLFCSVTWYFNDCEQH